MLKRDGPINVAILAVPEVTASSLFGMFDLFSSPGRDFKFITQGTAGEQCMKPFIVARTAEGFNAANGIWVRPDFALSNCPTPDIVCIPDFFVDPSGNVNGQYAAEAHWLKRVHSEGAMLASACSGAVLLGEAGLLNNCEATIHWGYVAMLTNNYTGVKVKPNQSLVLSGEAQRILMAGGGSSWQDLTLYLIARFVGIKEAIEVARVYLLQWHDLGQQPFASLMYSRQSADALISQCQEWIAQKPKGRRIADMDRHWHVQLTTAVPNWVEFFIVDANQIPLPVLQDQPKSLKFLKSRRAQAVPFVDLLHRSFAPTGVVPARIVEQHVAHESSRVKPVGLFFGRLEFGGLITFF